jgi:histidinol-phosphate aminotransferase
VEGVVSNAAPTSLDLARASYREIALYAPERAPCAVDLSDNTNTWGVPPAAERELRDAALSSMTRYPNLSAASLKEALAGYLGTKPLNIVTGCGSDDVLDSAIRAFAEPGDRIAYPDPSFAMIPIFARLNGLSPVPVPLTESLDVDADAMLATDARIIYLCSPNNPTGGSLSRAAIARIVAEAPGVVILDEAYAEFAAADNRDLLATSERVLVTRTMSKAFGLAGLRVGYAAGAAALVAAVEKSRGPYKVSAIAERMALAALGEGLPWVRDHVLEAVANREQLREELHGRGLAPLPSDANFVLVPTAGAGARARAMRARGVAVRPFENLPGVARALRDTGGSALRISVGPWPMMQAMLDALDATAAESR